MPTKRKVHANETLITTPTKKTKTTRKSIVALAEEQPKLSPIEKARKIRKVDRSIRQLIGAKLSDDDAAESESDTDSSLTDISSDELDVLDSSKQTQKQTRQEGTKIKSEQDESDEEDEDEEEWENVLNESGVSAPETPGPSSIFKPKGQDLVLTLDKDNAKYVPLS